ncbi:MAG TPA: LLM class F420-dependent oxidoreductase, partial [Ilumatobacteraceae bacterium]|nr:LLM class F420-dependent oxidoreductase [Ilumatobacteraceae bacterium]
MGTPLVGLFAPTAWPGMTAAALGALGPDAEARGFESLWVAEHVVTFDERSSGNAASGTLDPFVALTALAAHTSTIRLGTGVTLVSQRQPLFLAKQVASLDQISCGRVDFGVGLGWIRQEFQALGLKRSDRALLADRCLAMLHTLWYDDVSTYSDEHFTLNACRAYPKPVQDPLPIHVGGHSDAALRRVARFGHGWYAFDLDVQTFVQRRAALAVTMAEHGRSIDELQISVCPFRHPGDADAVRRYGEAGADRVIL